ncbi:hypothetical protein NVT68_008480, partial [Clostridium botulinum]|uniref:hypothetical protein n=1 Tax=Clostridium botulinum TaxID=1491 RepID=UPI0024AE445B
ITKIFNFTILRTTIAYSYVYEMYFFIFAILRLNIYMGFLVYPMTTRSNTPIFFKVGVKSGYVPG